MIDDKLFNPWGLAETYVILDPYPLGSVISLCDKSGVMVRDWAEEGYWCFCVDTEHSIRSVRVERVGRGIIFYEWGDIRTWTPPEWAPDVKFVAGFPPCTDLTVAQSRDMQVKGLHLFMDGMELFNRCYQLASWSRAPFCVENPKGVIGPHFRKADHSFDPYHYGGYVEGGEQYQKRTFLWVGNGFVMPEHKAVPPAEGSKMHSLPDSLGREELRSLTPRGFARAVYEANRPSTVVDFFDKLVSDNRAV